MDKKFFKTKKTFLLMILTMSPLSLEARIDKKREKEVLINPYSRENRAQHEKVFSLTEDKDFLQYLKETFLIHKDLRLEEMKKTFLPSEVTSYNIFFKNKILCEQSLKVIKNSQVDPLVFGKKIYLLENHSSSEDFSFLPKAKKIAQSFHTKEEGSKFFVSSGEACYFYEENKLTPAYLFKIQVDKKVYEIFVSQEKILKTKELFLSLEKEVTGKIQTYAKNSILSDLKTFPFSFTGTGFLENNRFETYLDTGAPANLTRAYSKEHQFIYSPEDPFFAEASVFAHAANIYNFFLELGFKEWSTEPFLIKIYSLFGENKSSNNAMYVPYDEEFNNRPVISIGKGDGLVLKNLLLDSDVISHELSHHIIFSTLTSTVEESLAIHEGLADYFSFAYSGDACLGETICPETSLACVVYKKCLRTGSNSLLFDDENLMGLDWHKEGQIISGVLWDLRRDLGEKIVDKLILRSIGYFISDAGYYSLILSLMRADELLYKGKHQCQIFDSFLRRGFDSYLEDVSCDDLSKWKEPEGTDSEDYLRNDKKEPIINNENYEDNTTCGSTVYVRNFRDNDALFFIFLVLAPLLFAILHRIAYYKWLYKLFSFHLIWRQHKKKMSHQEKRRRKSRKSSL